MFPYSHLETLTTAELQTKVDRLISRVPDAEDREKLEAYMNQFYGDSASLIELAIELMAGTYS